MAVEPEGSGCAGVAVLVAAALGTGASVYAVSRDLFVIVVWAIGAVLVYRAGKKVPDAPNPAPPPPSEGVAEKKSQVSVVRDTGHPNRWLILKPSRWMASNINDKDES